MGFLAFLLIIFAWIVKVFTIFKMSYWFLPMFGITNLPSFSAFLGLYILISTFKDVKINDDLSAEEMIKLSITSLLSSLFSFIVAYFIFASI